MTSQLNVDTIVDKAGSGGSNIKIANTSVAVSEGGTATTTTLQGLAKAWGHIAASDSTTFDDSFMFGTVTDNGTGNWSYAFTNNMANNDYSFVSIHGDAASNSAFSRPTSYATSSIQFYTYIGTGTSDATLITSTVHGDLA